MNGTLCRRLYIALRLMAQEPLFMGWCALFLTLTSFGLRHISFFKVAGMMDRMAGVVCWRTRNSAVDVDRVIKMVQLAGRVVKNAKCLPQALVAHSLLKHRGVSSELVVGFRPKDIKTGGTSHAWVKCNGRVVLGGTPDLDTYVSMSVLGDIPKDCAQWSAVS